MQRAQTFWSDIKKSELLLRRNNKEIKLVKVCYFVDQNLLSSFCCLLSAKLETKLYKSIKVPVVSYGFESCAVSLKEEQRLGVPENRLLRRILRPKLGEVTKG
jgi:hypothetical protein